jgi:hypothetical protein
MTSRPDILPIVTDEDPATTQALPPGNDVVLHDREHDPAEMHNLAADPGHHRTLLENLIDSEIGGDPRAWVTERPRPLGRPTWHGGGDRPETLACAESQTRH